MKSTPRMIRIGTLFILLVLLMNPAHAQNIDSLEVLAKTSTDIDFIPMTVPGRNG